MKEKERTDYQIDFIPLGSNVVILPDIKPEERMSEAGLYLLEESKETTTGRIVAINDDIIYGKSKLNVGVRVLFSPWAGFALTLKKKVYKILGETEVLGILTENVEAEVQ